jgi:hypothetical protein
MAGHAFAAAPGKSTVVHGAYQGLWNDLDIGLTLDGFTMRPRTSGIDITADVGGETVLETLYSGMNLSVQVTLENWNAEAIDHIIWWHGNSDPATYEWGLVDGVGQSMWDAAKPLILYSCDAVGFSSADVTGDTTITPSTGANTSNPFIDPLDIVFPKTILRKDEELEIALSYRPRFITLTLDVLPISNLFNATDWDPTAPDDVERVNACGQIRYFAATRSVVPPV